MASTSNNLHGHQVALPLSDHDTLAAFAPEPSSLAEAVNDHLMSHPFVTSLFGDPQFNVSRPHLRDPLPIRSSNLTAGTLLGIDRITVPPLAFSKSDGSRYVSVIHLGSALCGHPGFIHGGMLATLMDEGLAGCCFPTLPKKSGVTVSLKLEYKKPCKAEGYVVIRAETTKVEGRKAWVKGTLERLTENYDIAAPEVLVEAEAFYVGIR